MSAPTVYWLVEVSKVLGRAIPFFGTVIGFVTLIYDLGTTMVVGGLNFVLEQISAIDTTAFSQAAFGLIAGIGYFNAVFPLNEALTIWAALLTAKLAIILLRWVKSFIPTLAN